MRLTYAEEDWRARLSAYDWAALEAQLAQESAPASNADQKIDIKGLKRDTAFFVGYQIATIAILYAMPEGISSWSEESKENYSLQQWEDNVRHPRWDKDDYFINYILHPYWGATYYARARHRNLSRTQSFWYSVLLSTLYEYGAEALFEQPSIQDLVVTPLGAIVMGEYFYRVHNDIQARRDAGEPLTHRQRWALALTDLLGAINKKTEGLFGKKAQLSLQPFAMTIPHKPLPPALNSPALYSPTLYPPGAGPAQRETFGLELRLRY
jgi:hypothetical protein